MVATLKIYLTGLIVAAIILPLMTIVAHAL